MIYQKIILILFLCAGLHNGFLFGSAHESLSRTASGSGSSSYDYDIASLADLESRVDKPLGRKASNKIKLRQQEEMIGQLLVTVAAQEQSLRGFKVQQVKLLAVVSCLGHMAMKTNSAAIDHTVADHDKTTCDVCNLGKELNKLWAD